MLSHPISEKKATLTLSSILALRMLGLFMVLPILSPYLNTLDQVTPTLMGIAVGIYGLTQALLQIPFGALSDNIGRKPAITVGLFLFVVGCIIAATTHSITGMIIGRCLQGAGAIGSTLLALLSDLTSEKNRTKAMAITGVVIGTSFLLSLMIGPLLRIYFSVPAIFWICGILAGCAITLLHTQIPTIPVPPRESWDHYLKAAKIIWHEKKLNFFYFSILWLHVLLTSLFVSLPIVLHHEFTFTPAAQGGLYAGSLLLSLLITFPLFQLEKKKSASSLLYAIISLLLGHLVLLFGNAHQWFTYFTGLILFFGGFNGLEAALPSLVSKQSPVSFRGMAMGVLSTCQFLGIFLGGLLGGWMQGHYQFIGVLWTHLLLIGIWLWLQKKLN